MRPVFVCIFFVFLVITVFGGHPGFPEKKVCSFQASGNATLIHWNGNYSGTATMKRANCTAIYHLNMTSDSSGKAYNAIILCRPDVEKSFFKSPWDEEPFTDYPRLERYIFDPTLNPIPDRDYYSYSDGIGAMFFSTDGNMNLIGEYLHISQMFIAEYLTIVYDRVEEYVHDQIDDVFTIPDFDFDADARTQAPWALSSACDDLPSSSVFIGSSSSSSSSSSLNPSSSPSSSSSSTSNPSSSSSSSSNLGSSSKLSSSSGSVSSQISSSSSNSFGQSSKASSHGNSSTWLLPSFATTFVTIVLALFLN